MSEVLGENYNGWGCLFDMLFVGGGEGKGVGERGEGPFVAFNMQDPGAAWLVYTIDVIIFMYIRVLGGDQLASLLKEQ